MVDILNEKSVEARNESIVFRFKFSSQTSMKSAFSRLHERVEYAEMKVKREAKNHFVLSVTRVMRASESEIEKAKKDLSEDVRGFGGHFLDWKFHKIYIDGVLQNKKIRPITKLLHILTPAGDARTFRKYRIPVFTFVSILFLLAILEMLFDVQI
jgi:hypothetical protein